MGDFGVYIGIDVGKDGAICMVDMDGAIVETYKMPLIGLEYDEQGIRIILEYYNVRHVVIERVGAIHGASKSANITLGEGFGIVKGITSAMQLKRSIVPPKKWQDEMFAGVRRVKKPTKGRNKKGETIFKIDTKATALLAAKSLYPKFEFTPKREQKYYADNSENRRKGRAGEPVPLKPISPDDGIVDAVLMAEYCRRKFK